MIITLGQTTNERVRGVYGSSSTSCGNICVGSGNANINSGHGNCNQALTNPANEGCWRWRNWSHVLCCRRVPESKIPRDFSEMVYCEPARLSREQLIAKELEERKIGSGIGLRNSSGNSNGNGNSNVTGRSSVDESGHSVILLGRDTGFDVAGEIGSNSIIPASNDITLDDGWSETVYDSAKAHAAVTASTENGVV